MEKCGHLVHLMFSLVLPITYQFHDFDVLNDGLNDQVVTQYKFFNGD